jgi:hypothetical protein
MKDPAPGTHPQDHKHGGHAWTNKQRTPLQHAEMPTAVQEHFSKSGRVRWCHQWLQPFAVFAYQVIKGHYISCCRLLARILLDVHSVSLQSQGSRHQKPRNGPPPPAPPRRVAALELPDDFQHMHAFLCHLLCLAAAGVAAAGVQGGQAAGADAVDNFQDTVEMRARGEM